MENNGQCHALFEVFKPVVCSKCRGMLTQEVVHHVNTVPHMVQVTVEAIQKVKFELPPHQVYSADLIQVISYHSRLWCMDTTMHTSWGQGHVAYMALHTDRNIPCSWHQEAPELREQLYRQPRAWLLKIIAYLLLCDFCRIITKWITLTFWIPPVM